MTDKEREDVALFRFGVISDLVGESWYQNFGQCIKVESHALTKERNP